MPNFDQVRPGSPLQIPAATWNELMRVLLWWRALPPDAIRPKPRVRELDTIKLRNQSGEDLDAFHVLGLDDPSGVLPEDDLDEFKFHWRLEGSTPNRDTHFGRFAVLLEPAPAGELVEAAVDGMVVTLLDVEDEAHTHADVVTDEYLLRSGPVGHAEILWKEDGVGEKWALVRLGAAEKPRLGTRAADLAGGFIGPGDVTEWKLNEDGTVEPTELVFPGYNEKFYKLKAGTLYKWLPIGGRYVAVELASRTWAGTIAGSVSAGGTTPVTLSDGSTHTATNVSGQTLEAGAVLATDDAYTGNMLITGSADPNDGGGETEVWAALAVDNISPGANGAILLPDATRGTSGVVTATHWANGFSAKTNTGEPILAWQDPTDDNYYFIKTGHERFFKGQLAGALLVGDSFASIDNIAALDGRAAPTGVAAKNLFGCAGDNNYNCLFVEDWSDLVEGSPTYILVKVKHIKQEVVTDYRYDTSSHKLQKKTRDLVVMHEGEESEWTDVQAFTGYTAVTAVDWSSPNLTKKTRLLFCPEAGTESSATNVLSFTQIDVITNTAVDSGVLKHTKRTAYVMAPGSSTTDTVFTPTLQRVVEKVEDIGVALVQTYVDVYVWRVDEGFTEGVSTIGPCNPPPEE